MMAVSIRKLKKEDASAVRKLLVRLMSGLSDRYYPAHFIAAQKKLYTDAVIVRKLIRPDSVSFGAFQGARSVGFVIGFEMAPGLFYAEWGGVAPAVRRKGIMDRLMRRLEAAAKRQKGHKIYFYTSLKNIPAARAYVKYGYAVEGVLRNHFFGGDFLFFGKTLRRRKFSVAYLRRPDFPARVAIDEE